MLKAGKITALNLGISGYKMYKIFLPLLFSTLLCAEPLNGVSVMVKGDIITLHDIKEEMRKSNIGSAAATDMLIRKKLESIEMEERKISVTSSEVYEDIKKIAAANNMSVDQLYEAARESAGLTSVEFKEKTKEKLLSQKLYSSIAYSSIDIPKDDEIKEYYELHRGGFSYPVSFDVMIYSARDRDELQKQMANPMYNASGVKIEEQRLLYDKIAPELAKMLQNTKEKSFSPIATQPNGFHVSFFVKEIQKSKEPEYETLKSQIVNLIMEQKREQVLGDYFARLRGNAEIKVLREVK